jgi:DNA polymerase-3 subunit epsilon
LRELVLDTETTGLDFSGGDRIVEIGIVELENHIETGNFFHHYLNPEKESSLEALKVHGLTTEFLSDKPKFADVADELIKFIGDSIIVIHNASFDIGFLNAELKNCNMPAINEVNIIDTIILAKNKFRGQSISLDSLCRKYNIDFSNREIHGALKDAKLLALVYLELIGGKQTKLKFQEENELQNNETFTYKIDLNDYYKNRKPVKQKESKLNLDDYRLHIESIKKIPNKIWDCFKN